MTPPIKRPGPIFTDYFRDDDFGAGFNPGGVPLKDGFRNAPAKSSWDLGGAFSLGTLFRFPLGGPGPLGAPKPVATASWMEFAAQLAGGVESMDLDFYDVPTNRGTGLCRFSEYTPRAERPDACSVTVQPNTKAKVHGEIRPIKGTTESLITRVVVDYFPNVVSLIKTFPNLEVDGFAAVDSPDMDFDKKFLDRTKSVKSTSGGDFNYENPMSDKPPSVKAFGEEVDAPPNGHRDWMFRFMPAPNTLIGGLEELIADKKGSLMLWAFLPTMGIVDDQSYAKFGIRYNTFPRNFGDLVKFLTPVFDPKQSAALKRNAPFINPNTEYIDSSGQRQKIPEDPAEVIKINAERAKVGRPALGRNRGSVIDWIFTDLANNLDRMKDLKSSDIPRALLHVKFRETLLKLPLGQLGIDANTDIKAHYYMERVENPTSHEVHARLGLNVTASPLGLNNIDLQIGNFHIQAKSLKAKKLTVSVPNIPGLVNAGPKEDLPISIHLEGVTAEGLKVDDGSGQFNIEMESAQLGDVDFVKSERSWKLLVNGLKEDDLHLKFPLGELSVKKAEIEPETDPKTPKKLRIVQSFDEHGKPTLLSVRLPELKSAGGITVGDADAATYVKMEGSSVLKDVEFYRQEEKGQSTVLVRADYSGSVDSARIKHGPLGVVQFSTVDNSGTAPQRHEFSGSFRSTVVLPKDPTQPKTPADYALTMQVPYVGFGTEGRLTMAPGASTLRNGTITLKPGNVALEGDLDFNASQLKGLGEGPTELGRFILPEGSPNILDLKFQGRARFEFKKDGWSLGKPDNSTVPLKISFKLQDTELQHHPDLEATLLKDFPAAKIVGTKVKIKEAQVQFDDLRRVEYGQFFVQGEKRGRLSALDSGPITVHHIQGSGSIWVNLAIWGFVRGLFPNIGGDGGTPTKSYVVRPSSAPLTAHLSEEVRTLLGDKDFFRLGEVNFKRFPNGDWSNTFKDLILNIHEDGGRGQFGMFRLPELNLNLSTPSATPDVKDYTFDFGKGDFSVNVFLNDPDRGGAFQFVRWPEKPKKK